MISLICEFLAVWLGGTHRQELAGITGLQRRRLTTLLRDDLARRGRKTIRYDKSLKRFVAQQPDGTEPHGVKSPDDVLATLSAIRAWGKNGAWHMLNEPPIPCPVVSTSSYRKQPDPEIFRTLLGACARQKVVSIDYRARGRDITTYFSPHTVVQTAQRVHFRGYSLFDSSGNGHYWDLVSSRVMRAEVVGQTGYVDGSGDLEWLEETELELALSPEIPQQMRSAIRREHGMEGDLLKIGPLPRALLQYVLAEYVHRQYEGYPFHVWLKQGK